MSTEEQLGVVVDEAVEGARDPAARRGQRLGIAALILGLLIVAVMIGHQAVTIGALGDQADRNAVVAQQLADQIRASGGIPVVQPPAPGQRGDQGERGEPGATGLEGPPGPAGTDGTTPPCLAEPGQCRGTDGQNGTPGAPGVNGTPGEPGEPGPPGPAGQDGQDGVDGRPPAGWTWVDGDGRTQSCARDLGSPDAAPTYTCTAPSDGPPGSTTSPPLLPLGR